MSRTWFHAVQFWGFGSKSEKFETHSHEPPPWRNEGLCAEVNVNQRTLRIMQNAPAKAGGRISS